MVPPKPLVAVDLFCGAGGMSCGLEPPAAVHEVTGEALQRRAAVDHEGLVVGGPPCQGSSNAGYRDPSAVRNSLVFQFGRLVSELRPTFLVMENVVGMLSFRVDRDEL